MRHLCCSSCRRDTGQAPDPSSLSLNTAGHTRGRLQLQPWSEKKHQEVVRNSFWLQIINKMGLVFFALTTLCQWPVAVEVVDSNSSAPEQLCPVYSVVVTEVGILTDVHAAITDLPQRAQAQWGESRDAHHHQRKTSSVTKGCRTEEETEKVNKTEVRQRTILSSKKNSKCVMVKCNRSLCFSSVEKWQSTHARFLPVHSCKALRERKEAGKYQHITQGPEHTDRRAQ